MYIKSILTGVSDSGKPERKVGRPKMAETMRQLHQVHPSELIERLEKRCKQLGISVSDGVRIGIELFLLEDGKQKRP